MTPAPQSATGAATVLRGAGTTVSLAVAVEAGQSSVQRCGPRPVPDVVALRADGLGDEPDAHEPGEDLAAQAEPEDGLERGGCGERAEGDGGGELRTEPEGQHGGGDREQHTNALGEPLRRPGD